MKKSRVSLLVEWLGRQPETMPMGFVQQHGFTEAVTPPIRILVELVELTLSVPKLVPLRIGDGKELDQEDLDALRKKAREAKRLLDSLR